MDSKILVVDDDASARSGLELLLRRQGYDVRSAADGLSALAECTAFQPDLVLLDVVMPGLSGFEVCRQIKAHAETRLIPVVLVTGLSERDNRLEGIDAGADDFLNKPIDVNELSARVRSLLRLKSFTDELENAEAVLFSLALSIEARDPHTYGHCARLAEFSAGLGEQLGLPEEELKALRRAGVVHDVGKVVVPDAVLLKRGPLSVKEQMLMRQHPIVGERICAPLKSFRLVLPIIRHHHERWDGSGYPDGIEGEAIPLTARVLQVADVYDALTTDRPYKRALAPAEAWKVIQDEARRGWRDRRLVEEFKGLMLGHAAPLSTTSGKIRRGAATLRKKRRARR
jgi:putative two-component system response regulator